jgi:pimeloyl-ACP methyl ester carboxylesterase
MTRAVLLIAAIAALIYLGLCVALFLAQRSFIYYPQPRYAGDNTPTFTLNANGERIQISTHPAQGTDAGAGAVIYFGGNAEAVSYSLPTLAAAFPERSLYAMNYRGYGGSTGKPSEAALTADARVLFDRVHADHPNIIVIGRSLGSGVAVQLATERPVERLILITPFDSLLNVAARQFGFFPLSWLMLDKFESWRYAPKVTAPTHLIAAEHDEVIPASSTAALYKHFSPSLATLTTVLGAGHNSISESPAYIPLLRSAPSAP